jgi:hypothetical protein
VGLYDFKKRFVPRIRKRTKLHTIRGVRKYPDKPGDLMYLYHGLRTKKAKRIAVVECVKVEPIRIEMEYPDAEVALSWEVLVYVNDIWLTDDEVEALARADGFRNWEEMVLFWDGRLPFEGFIYHWKWIPKRKVYDAEKSHSRTLARIRAKSRSHGRASAAA